MSYPPVETSRLWKQIRDYLDADATMIDLLYGSGHVYVEADDYALPEGEEGAPWVRVVIAPAGPLWPHDEAPGLLTRRSFIVRAECNKFDGPGYDHQLALEGVQSRIKLLLDGYVPDPIVGVATRVAFPIYYYRVIEPRILWDEMRRLYFLTTEYRTELTSA